MICQVLKEEHGLDDFYCPKVVVQWGFSHKRGETQITAKGKLNQAGVDNKVRLRHIIYHIVNPILTAFVRSVLEKYQDVGLIFFQYGPLPRSIYSI